MTGFGLGEAEVPGLSLRVEVRSVNHRFLQARYKLPSEFTDLEPKVDQLVKKKLSRGAVTLSVFADRAAAPSTVVVDEEVAARYKRLLTKAAKGLSIENDLSLSTLIGLPGVIGTAPDPKAHQREGKALLKGVADAIEALLAMRETEGASMAADVRKQCKAIERLRASIEKRMPAIVRGHFEGMRQRAEALLGGEGAFEERELARELALLAERSDVSEELSRLDSHLAQLDGILEKGGEVGRKLDFLVQELHREVNTIGSKASDAKVAHSVVELKTHIERIREQVQNVE